MDNTTLLVIGAIVIIGAIYFSKKKDSTPADVSESLPAGKAEQENSSGTVEK